MSSDSIVTERESRVTSTPQGSPATSDSPSISPINSSCTSVSQQNSGLAQVGGDSSEDESALRELASNEDQQAPNSLNTRENFLRIFKPRNQSSLYGIILCNPNAVKDATVELLTRYKIDPKLVIESILKLFIDVCGYQRFNIEDVYKYLKCEGKETIRYLEYQPLDVELLKAGTFLMQECQSGDAAIVRETLYQFIHTIVLTAHDLGILYDDLFPVHVFVFIRCMAFSSTSPIRHTGILFSLKFMTGCAVVHQQICHKLKNGTTGKIAMNNEYILKLKDQQHTICNYINFFYLIFSKNCLIPNQKASYVRAECVEEIEKWIMHIPQYILMEKEFVKFLVKLLEDASSNVRLNAVRTSEVLISLAEHDHNFKPLVKFIACSLRTRILDVDLTVAAKTCNVLTHLLNVFPELIEVNCYSSILKCMYDNDYKLAEACAQFTTAIIRRGSNDVEEFLCLVAKINGIPPLNDKTSLLVEALLESTPELQNWEAFLSTLLNSNLQFEMRNSLLQILLEVLQQITSTECVRTGRNKNKSDNSKTLHSNSNITRTILPKITNLLNLYGQTKECVLLILKIISALDYPSERSNYNIYYNDIIKNIQIVLLQSSDVCVIGSSVTALFSFYEKIPEDPGMVIVVLQTLEENYNKILLESEIVNPTSDEFNSLSFMAKKFSSVKKLKMEYIKDIMQFGMQFVFSDKKNYQFLYLLKYFVQQLPVSEKNELLEKFQCSVPDIDKQDDVILFFSKLLETPDHSTPSKTPCTCKNKQDPENKGQAKKKQELKRRKEASRSASKSKQLKTSSATNRTQDFSIHDESSDDMNVPKNETS